MDIEKLNKSQIVLLTLLISFVTSIATGIVTVSLMDQAPPVIAQTVNRVIEHTVERVVPAVAAGKAAAAVAVTTEKTVVIKESDLITQALERIRPSIVQIYTGASDSAVFLGLGIVIDSDGTVLIDSSSLGDISEPGVVFPDGNRVRATVALTRPSAGTATLHIATSTSVEGKPLTLTPAKFALGPATLGQTVIALSGKTIPRIADGLVSALIPVGEKIDVVDTNIASDLILSGTALINTDGAVIGVSTGVSRTSSAGGFMASSAIFGESGASQ